jgi:D-threonine aldolase
MLDLSAFDNVQLDNVLTPCLAVSPAQIRRNLQAMIVMAGDVNRLRPHVKTHKCAEIVKLAQQLGINKHKCATLAEAEMLAELGGDILVAYPLVGPNVSQLVRLVKGFPQVQFSTLVETPAAAQFLSQSFNQAGVEIDVLADMNVGMNRTGILPSRGAQDLVHLLTQLPALRFKGLHIYDGHNHQVDSAQRAQAVEQLMQPIQTMIEELGQRQIAVEKLVCGGTPTFPIFANWARRADTGLPPLELSPGTSVLSDYNYDRDYSDLVGVSPAAILLTRIISKPAPGLVTVDLGHKAVAADPPAGRRCFFPEIADAEELKHNEEHLVIRTSLADQLQVGQVLRVLPAHICPTVALHEQLLVIQAGKVADLWPVTRHRVYVVNC